MPTQPGIDLNDTGNRIVAGIVLALIFMGGWWLIARNASGGFTASQDSSDTQEVGAPEDTVTPSPVLGPISEETPTIAGSHESVSVEDQAAGMTVRIKAATLAQIGWIAVRDADGRTLGAGRFEAGAHESVEVPLLRATIAGERYQVLIYVDDGDKIFDLHKDILVMRADGSVAGSIFGAK